MGRAGKWTPLSEFISNLQVKIAAYFKQDSIHDRQLYISMQGLRLYPRSFLEVQLVCAIIKHSLLMSNKFDDCGEITGEIGSNTKICITCYGNG